MYSAKNNPDKQEFASMMKELELPVLASTRAVVEQSQHVTISDAAIHRMLMNGYVNGIDWHPELHIIDPDWIFVLDALNFCFWEDRGQPKWSIAYKGQQLSGYWALAGGLKRAYEEGVPLTNAEYLSTISSKVVERMFEGQERIPLFQKRVDHLREIGTVLLQKYDGTFVNVLEQTRHSTVALVTEVVANFPCFNDVAMYRGQPVYFYKRAQLLAADLYGAFEGQGYGQFLDLDQLTIFADYKLPQVLRHHQIIQYDQHLAALVDNYTPIAPGSVEEVEIRAATVQAVERMRQYFSQKHQTISAFKLDWWLWTLGQEDAVREKPYHRTRSVFY
jgi:hypothetical protein